MNKRYTQFLSNLHTTPQEELFNFLRDTYKDLNNGVSKNEKKKLLQIADALLMHLRMKNRLKYQELFDDRKKVG